MASGPLGTELGAQTGIVPQAAVEAMLLWLKKELWVMGTRWAGESAQSPAADSTLGDDVFCAWSRLERVSAQGLLTVILGPLARCQASRTVPPPPLWISRALLGLCHCVNVI